MTKQFTIRNITPYEANALLAYLDMHNKFHHYNPGNEVIKPVSAVLYIDGFFDLTITNPTGHDYEEVFKSELAGIRQMNGSGLYQDNYRTTKKIDDRGINIIDEDSPCGLMLAQKRKAAGLYTEFKKDNSCRMIGGMIYRGDIVSTKCLRADKGANTYQITLSEYKFLHFETRELVAGKMADTLEYLGLEPVVKGSSIEFTIEKNRAGC